MYGRMLTIFTWCHHGWFCSRCFHKCLMCYMHCYNCHYNIDVTHHTVILRTVTSCIHVARNDHTIYMMMAHNKTDARDLSCKRSYYTWQDLRIRAYYQCTRRCSVRYNSTCATEQGYKKKSLTTTWVYSFATTDYSDASSMNTSMSSYNIRIVSAAKDIQRTTNVWPSVAMKRNGIIHVNGLRWPRTKCLKLS
jgi:hypothetical protein